jgi:uncharacterized protein YndB with AHSA1/START domain
MAMALPEYRFLDHWFVPAPIEDVYDVVGDVKGYPAWWGEAFLSAEGDDGPPAPGRRISVVSRGYLPYKLRWSVTCTEVEPPKRIASRLEGDFEGSGTWLLEPAPEGTNVALDWRPQVAKPIVRAFTPVSRRLFRRNHAWAMRRGQEHVADEVASRMQARQAGA